MSHVFEVSDEEYATIERAARERGQEPVTFFQAWVASVRAHVEHGTIDPEQAWFWTPEWQAKEREVDEAMARGVRGEVYENEEDYLRALDDLDVGDANE